MGGMLWRKTLENIRSDVDAHSNKLETQIEQATAVLSVTLLIIGAMAAFAVIYTVIGNETRGQNDG